MNRMPDLLTHRLAPVALCLVLAACAQPSAAPPTSTAVPTAPQAAASPAVAAPARAAPRRRRGAGHRPRRAEGTGPHGRLSAHAEELRGQRERHHRLHARQRPGGAGGRIVAHQGAAARRLAGRLEQRRRRPPLFYFNGKTATVYDPDNKYYATVPAPATIKEVAQVLNDRYGIELPALDLFAWGTDQVDTSAHPRRGLPRRGDDRRPPDRPFRAAPGGLRLAGLGRARHARRCRASW